MSAELSVKLAGALSEHLGRPVVVDGLKRLAGGSSHETWGFVAIGGDGADTSGPLPLVLRREFERGLLDTDLRAEFDLLRALHGAGLPVPEPLICVTTHSPLGLPFMVMQRVEGTDLRKDLARDCGADSAKGAAGEPARDCGADSAKGAAGEPARDRVALAAQAVELQGRIHGVDPAAVPGLAGEWGAEHEVRRWAAVLEAALIHGGKAGPEPLLTTAFTWLRVNPPGPAQPCLVHGDFKANNLLISPTGALTVIDWEMTHLGDPVEDLAWTMLWRTDWDIVGGLHTPAGYVQAYTEVTGHQVQVERLRFWRVFALAKLWTMFLTGMADAHVRPSLRLMGRSTVWLADQLARELLEAVRG